MRHKKTTEEFIQEAITKHNGFYSYSKAVYTGSKNLIVVTCPCHGDFSVRASMHLHGQECKRCSYEKRAFKKILKYSKAFIEKATAVHQGYYSYENVHYKNADDKIIITCPEHGNFKQRPATHLEGHGCTECGNEGKPGCINDAVLTRDLALANSEYYWYYVKLTNKTTGKTFWKVGIEKNLRQRWKSNQYFDAEYLWSVKGTCRYCFDLEQMLMAKHNTGVAYDEWPYSGRTEMLPHNFLI